MYQWIRNREKFPRLQLGKRWEAVSLAASYASIATLKAEEANRDSRMMPITLRCGKRSVNTVPFLEEGSSFTLVERAPGESTKSSKRETVTTRDLDCRSFPDLERFPARESGNLDKRICSTYQGKVPT